MKELVVFFAGDFETDKAFTSNEWFLARAAVHGCFLFRDHLSAFA